MIFEAKLFKVPPHIEFSPDVLNDMIGVEVKPVGSGTIMSAWIEDGWVMIEVDKHDLTGITREYRMGNKTYSDRTEMET